MPRKRTRYIITADQMKAFNQLKEMLNIERILNNTSIFTETIDYKNLDERTVNKIKESFTLWHKSWIKPSLDKL